MGCRIKTITKPFSFILWGAICSIFVSSCEKPAVVQTEVRLPVDRVLTDSIGRKLDATIIEKSATGVTLIRKNDGKRFEMPLSKLSKSDQIYFDRVAESAVKILPPEQVVAPYVKNRREMIERKQQEIEELRAEMGKFGEYETKWRNLERQIQQKTTEIRQLEEAISQYERDNISE